MQLIISENDTFSLDDYTARFSQVRVLVVGDVMLDRYWSGETSRISPEAPVPVVHVKTIEERPGGAANVALNLAALGAKVSLLSVCGDDPSGNLLEKQLQQAGVDSHLYKMKDMATITKIRVLSLHQQLLRLDFEDSFSLAEDQPKFFSTFSQLLTQADLVVLSDYGKGCLSSAQTFIGLARQANKPVFVDPKSRDFSLYRGATLLTPNQKEFEASTRSAHHDEQTLLSQATETLRQQQLDALLVTQGEDGMTLFRADHPPLHIPAHAREVFDITGAGDTVIATLAVAFIATQGNLAHATKIANIAAGVVVGKLGAANVSVSELKNAAQPIHLVNHGIVTQEGLILLLQEARLRGERVVMTGGCFDILHAGHVAYLEQAKKLGDRLIVAVNDDASVRLLKGDSRPIHALEQRMSVLSGLASVDWVVPFSEATPELLIQRVLPDVWVKGGDYSIQDLPEAEWILANGGEVKILPLVDGCSTSQTIAKINGV